MELTLDVNRRYTYADYLTWVDDKARELIDGFIRMMAPAANTAHQRTCIRLSAMLHDEGIEVFLLQPDGKYDDGTKYETGKIPVHIFDGYEIDIKDIF